MIVWELNVIQLIIYLHGWIEKSSPFVQSVLSNCKHWRLTRQKEGIVHKLYVISTRVRYGTTGNGCHWRMSDLRYNQICNMLSPPPPLYHSPPCCYALLFQGGFQCFSHNLLILSYFLCCCHHCSCSRCYLQC